MAEAASSLTLLRLMSWLSPAFPVGAFAYSHGLEQAIHAGLVRDRQSLTDWLVNLVEHGSGRNDAVLLAEAWRTAGTNCGVAVAELAEAMAGSKERQMETTLQGAAFAAAMDSWEAEQFDDSGRERLAARGLAASTPSLPSSSATPYPVAVGLAAARHGIALEPALAAYLHAFTSNLIQASVRLVPLGQRDGVATVAALEPVILATAKNAAGSTLDELGSCTVMSDIMSMQHETLYSRVFRS